MLPREIGCFLWKNIPEPWVTALQNGFAANPQGLRRGRSDRAPLCRTACSRGNSGVLDLHHIGRVQISNTGAGVGVLFGGVHNALISPAVQIVQILFIKLHKMRSVILNRPRYRGSRTDRYGPQRYAARRRGCTPTGEETGSSLVFLWGFFLTCNKAAAWGLSIGGVAAQEGKARLRVAGLAVGTVDGNQAERHRKALLPLKVVKQAPM